ncbi:MAG: hypothetical protein QM791_04005 [Ferruginibacter sp.]
MMENEITGVLRFEVESQKYELNYQRYYLSNQIEKIKVYGKAKEIHMQSDRPEIRLNNKKRTPKWKIISAINPEMYVHSKFYAMLEYVLENTLEHIDFPKPSHLEYIKNKKSW